MGGTEPSASPFGEAINHITSYYFWAVQHENHFAFFAAVFGIIGGVAALYKIFVTWDRTRRKLFTAYLNSQEKQILETKKLVADKLSAIRVGPDVTNELDVHSDIESALRLAERGKQADAELKLRTLQSKIEQRFEFAERQAKIARLQVSAVHLFLGSLHAASKKPEDAIEEFKKALAKSPHDTDALQYLGEQHLAMTNPTSDNRLGHASEAQEIGEKLVNASKFADLPVRKFAEVQGFKIQGLGARALGNPRVAGDLMKRAVELADELQGNDLLVAEVNDLLGDISIKNRYWKKAEEAFAVSAERFAKIGDTERSTQAREKATSAREKEFGTSTLVN